MITPRPYQEAAVSQGGLGHNPPPAQHPIVRGGLGHNPRLPGIREFWGIFALLSHARQYVRK